MKMAAPKIIMYRDFSKPTNVAIALGKNRIVDLFEHERLSREPRRDREHDFVLEVRSRRCGEAGDGLLVDQVHDGVAATGFFLRREEAIVDLVEISFREGR